MTTSNRRRFLTLTAAALATPALPRLGQAQAWPAGKPIRAVVPFSAGSTVDIIARIVLDPLSQQLGQTILVENRGGAGGSIGSAAVAKSDADGFTLLVNAAAQSFFSCASGTSSRFPCTSPSMKNSASRKASET